jgi:hypothetical protein
MNRLLSIGEIILPLLLMFLPGCTSSSDSPAPPGVPDLPEQAASPSPADGAVDVPVSTDLSWASASGATSYDVYLGTNLSSLALQNSEAVTAHDPGILAYSVEYFWRIDSVNANGATMGAV